MVWEMLNACSMSVTWCLPFLSITLFSPLLWDTFPGLSSLLPGREIRMQHTICHAEGSITLLCPSNCEKDPDDGKPGLLWASLFSLKAYISSTKKPHFRDTDSFRIHAPPLVANDRNEYLCSTLRYVNCSKPYLYLHALSPEALTI